MKHRFVFGTIVREAIWCIALRERLPYNRPHRQRRRDTEEETLSGFSRIRDNLQQVRERIRAACEHCGRRSEDVALIAVSKTIAPELVGIAVDAGAADLGENYVQEAQAKIEKLGRIARWHMIGHVQTNKAAKAAELFDMVQSVDSERLARKLSDAAAKAGRTLDVLVEVNISGEPAKTGVEKNGVLEIAEKVTALPNLSLRGVMAIPPFLDDPEAIRPYFRELAAIFQKLPPENRQVLSMGMSGDFETAIEEGATMVRVGTAIFGPRPRA